ncbi:MAG: helix-hairpin-helix domain-containing protein [Gammaproteobacteria bacterium]|nr:helix-hairpin-helix domain-containing protein [Gammaproteobacteria bacterium]
MIFCTPVASWAFVTDDVLNEDEYTQWVLSQWRQQPLDLNQAGLTDLLWLPQMTPTLASQILAHRQALGRFKSVSELTILPGVDLATYWLWLDYVTVNHGRRFFRWQMGTAASDQSSPSTVLAVEQRQRQWGLGSEWAERTGEKVSYNFALESWQAKPQSDILQPRSVFFWAEQRPWSYTLGHYRLAFGRGLSFANRPVTSAEGWSEPAPASFVASTGRYRFDDMLFGAAAQYECADCLGVRQQYFLFASSQLRDLYQYDLRFGPDAARLQALGECHTTGSQSMGFTCDGYGQWYATTVLDQQGQPLYYTQLRDAMHETLSGMAWLWGDTTDWRGRFVYYQANNQFVLAAPQLRFAPSAKFPSALQYQVAGLGLAKSWSEFALDGEVSVGNNGGKALLVWTSWHDENVLEQLTVRYYAQDYINPYSRGLAASDEYLGSRQRNEIGWLWQHDMRIGSVQWRGYVDSWRAVVVDANDTSNEKLWKQRWSQRVTQAIAPQFKLGAGIEQGAELMSVSLQLEHRRGDDLWQQQLRCADDGSCGWRGTWRLGQRRQGIWINAHHPLPTDAEGEKRMVIGASLQGSIQQQWQAGISRTLTDDERYVVWRVWREL